jgi:hypothetical protein
MDGGNFTESAEKTEALRNLEVRLEQEWETARSMRQTQEQVWLEDLRLYKGHYDPEVQSRFHPKRSQAFIRLIRAKTKSWTSRTHKLLFPAGDKNWTIRATSVPEIDAAKHRVIIEQLAIQRAQVMAAQLRPGGQSPEAMMGAPPAVTPQLLMQAAQTLTPDEIRQAIKLVADEAATKMEQQIDDDLALLEGVGYSGVARSVMHNGHLYGTGILKGPIREVVSEERWDQEVTAGSPEPQYVIAPRVVQRPHGAAVPCWSVYPDPYANWISECQHLYQRHVMNPVELSALRHRAGFRADLIAQYLTDNKEDGDAQPQPWESELQSMAASQQGKQVSGWRHRFQVLERWGWLMGWEMRECGIAIPEESLAEAFMVCLFKLGPHIIRVRRYPMRQRIPYNFYYYDKDDTSIWGEGIPRVGRDPQRLFNAAIRASVDNAAASSGPQVEVNKDLLEDDEDVSTVVPWRVWVRGGKGIEAQFPAVRVYQVASNVERTVALSAVFREQIDESTANPSYTYGQPQRGLTKTVGGLSMMMGNSNITLEDAAKSWDEGVTKPFIGGLYDYHMVYTPRPEIKGDFDVVATGSSSLMAKELRSQAVREYRMSTANPLDAPFTNRVYLLREEAKALDLDPKEAVITDDQMRIQAGMMQAAAAQEVAPGGQPGAGPPGQPGGEGGTSATSPGGSGGFGAMRTPDVAGQGIEPQQSTGMV